MLSHAERADLIARYAAGHAAVMEALTGITDEEWDAREAPGEWSPRQVAHHLAESEMTSALRLRQMLVNEQAEIVPYDQDAYARVLFYDRPAEASLAAFAAARAATVPILERMTDEQWSRTAHHREEPEYGTEIWLRYYSRHAHDHADQIRRARTTVRDRQEGQVAR